MVKKAAKEKLRDFTMEHLGIAKGEVLEATPRRPGVMQIAAFFTTDKERPDDERFSQFTSTD